ncbi:uncharacterized protein [Atheta coriaria]|uniref:uncharacterized protein n=1 Tax=Dalotia coriaria TaxID=877792 RepID=UPI0031F377C8
MNPNGRIKVSVMSRVIIARRIHSERYQLYQVYRISKDRPLVYEDFGYWSINEGLILTKQKGEITTRRRNLQGLFFVISSTLEHPETINYYNTIKYPETDSVIKQSYAMFANLVDIVNMTYANVFHNSFGHYNATTKKWTGHSESLRSGASNYSASAMVVMKQRLPIMDFVIQISQRVKIKFIFKNPPTSYVKDIFIISFHNHVWYALFATFLLHCIFIGYLLNIEKKYFDNTTGDAKDGALVTLESISQQGSVVTTKTLSGAILFFVLSLACMFFYNAYSSSIVTLLQSTTSINTIEELLNSPFEVGAEDTIYIKHFMRVDTDPVRKALYDTKVTEHGFLNLKEGLDRMRKGGYAFHIEKNPAYYYILRHFDINEICSLQRIEALYLPSHLIYIPMYKASPYKKIKKVGAFRILETGLHLRQVKLFDPEPKCTGIAPSFKTIELVDVQTAFVTFLIGLETGRVVPEIGERPFYNRIAQRISGNKKT